MSDFAIRRPVTTIMLTFIVIILGLIAFTNLQQELIPEMDFGMAVVFATYDGAGPEEIDTLITRPLQMALSTVTNLRNISTTSTAGSSIVFLEFEDGTDMNHAALNMRENIDLFRMLLPDGVDPHVLQIDPSMMQSFTIGVTGDFDLVRLLDIVDDQVVQRLERVDGVGSVTVSGGVEREISVEIDPGRLTNYGLTAQQIAGILAMENVNRPGGTMVQGGAELQLRTVGEFQSVDEIRNLPVLTPTGAVIRLSDVARVVDGFREKTSYALINGQQGIVLDIAQQSTANTVEVGRRIQSEIATLAIEFPELSFIIITDTSTFITATINNIWVTVLQATLLSMLVLLIFLGNGRSPLIIAVSIPVSLVASLAIMFFTGLTLNMITLNALLISVGLLIDNSIVVLESISRYVNEGLDPKEAASKGAKEVGLAVTVATLTTLAVFVPVLFVGGLAGEMFGSLGLVISFSLASSLIVALTFVPMACSKFLKPEMAAEIASQQKRRGLRGIWEVWNRGYKRVEEWYGRVISWALTHRKFVVLGFVLFVLGSGSVIGGMGMEFLAAMDQGMVSISVAAPDGALLEEVSGLTSVVLERIDDMDVIQDISVSVGGAGMMAAMFGFGGSNTANIQIQLIDANYREHIDIVMEEIRQRIEPLPGAELTVSAVDAMGADGMGGNSISFSLFGDEMDLLRSVGDEIVELISTLPMIRNAESSLQESQPQASVIVDRARASHHGLMASTVANTVQMAVAGMTVTWYREAGTEVDVVVRYQPERLVHITDLHNLMLATPFGTTIPLSEVAEIVVAQGPTAITRQNGRQMITISAEFVDTDLNSATQAVDDLLSTMVLPGGMSYEFGGAFEMMMESFAALGIAMVLGFVLLYMVMASQFESIAYPSTILFSIPVAWTAGLFGVWIMGDYINMVSFIGLILLMGIVTNNGIVMVDYINTKRREGLQSFDAIVFAAKVRLRPILMTSITTVVGLMPMMFAHGEGAEVQQPLGVIIVFGLSFSTMITLILIPVMYSLLHGFRKWFFEKFRKNEIMPTA
ncbi:MAG: efflux RND transporter permease subunit [Defluviitaleaceae bacterium]|nr:efflux RND transporter permease subunit [Defluviitaleaceae bacterium]MCL2262362.1 efflux RND transporter permease subunit [Defluviitaleaceae bacterium]